jgi:trigger factor
MNVTETSAEGLKREFKITVPAGDLEEQITRRLGELCRSIRIPGFRPGKVPLNLLRQRYGPAVRHEVLESTLQGSSAEAIREKNLRPALPPKVEIVSAAEGADLEYTMSLEVLPDLPEPDFSNLGLEKLAVEVPDEEIDRALERMAEQQRKTEPVDRPAETGDVAVVDFVGRIGDTEFPGGKGEGVSIELGAGRFVPGFEDQLVGAKAGEDRTVKVIFPADYGAPDLAGKDAVFEVTVKEVRQRLPQAVDDSLAEAVGLENLGELRQEIRQRMQREYDGVARQRFKRVLLDKLAEKYDFGVPPGMVEMEFNQIWGQYQGEKAARKAMAERAAAGEQAKPGNEAKAGEGPIDAGAVVAPEETALEGASERAPASAEAAHRSAQGSEPTPHHARPHPGSAEEPLDAAALVAPEETALEGASDTEPAVVAMDEDDEKAKAEYEKIAERRVRLGLLLAEVGRNNNITVTQEELNQALAQEARRHPGYERQVIDYYRNNPDAINNLRAPIFEEKVVDFIVELAKPEERKVTPQELLAGAEGESETAAETA